MTAPLSGNAPEKKVKGMFGGRAAPKGNDGTGNMAQVSGATRGQPVASWFWTDYPYVLGGQTEYMAEATMPGSNLSAAQQSTIASESKVGGGPSQAEVPDYGGTAAY